MTLQEIKHHFFAHRNGNTADILKRGGSRFRMIFGCDVPMLSSLAASIGKDAELAHTLWEDRDVRESRLLAPWLMDPGTLSQKQCVDMALDATDMEEAMMLAFRVLKRRADASEILSQLPPESPGALALARHLS